MKILLTASNTCTDPYPVYPLGMSVIAQALAAARERIADRIVEPFGFCRGGKTSANTRPKIRISESKSKLVCILPSGSIFGEAKVRISEGNVEFI